MLRLSAIDASVVMHATGMRRHRGGRSAAAVLACIVAALSIAGVVATMLGGSSMAAMGAEPMPGGWMLSNAWIRQCGRTPIGFALVFFGHWLAMTAAMMLPSFAPTLRRCRDTLVVSDVAHADWAVVRVALGWFAAWTVTGFAVFVATVVLTTVALREPALARCFPLGAAVIVLVAGALQFGAWKSRHLAGCRDASSHDRTLVSAHPWRHGLHLGRHCVCACAGWMATLLVTGAMDWRAMAPVALVIAAERVAPRAGPVVEKTGAALLGFGLALFAQAVVAG